MCMLNAWVLLQWCNEYQSFLMQDTSETTWTISIKGHTVTGFSGKGDKYFNPQNKRWYEWTGALWEVKSEGVGEIVTAGDSIQIKSEIIKILLMAALHSELLPVGFSDVDLWFRSSWKGCDLEVIGIDVLLYNFLGLIGLITRASVGATGEWDTNCHILHDQVCTVSEWSEGKMAAEETLQPKL